MSSPPPGSFALDTAAARGRDQAAAPPLLWLRVLLRRRTLDRLLAGGWHPAMDPRLALRAQQLARPALRARLAYQLRDAVRSIDGRARAPWHRSQIPVDAASVRACEDEIGEVALSLTDIAPRVRGVAIVNRLITDGLSPLYVPGATERLRMILLDACAAL